MSFYRGKTLNWEILVMDNESFATFTLLILKIDVICPFRCFPGLSRFPIPCHPSAWAPLWAVHCRALWAPEVAREPQGELSPAFVVVLEHAFLVFRLYFSFDYWFMSVLMLNECCYTFSLFTKEIMFSFLPSSSLCTCFLSATRLPLLCKTKQVGVIGWHFTWCSYPFSQDLSFKYLPFFLF